MTTLDELKYLKQFTATAHGNIQRYLCYNNSIDTWYFITDILGADLKCNDVTHIVIVEMKFTDSLFKDYFFDFFANLIEYINGKFQHYVFDVKVLNKQINDCLKTKEIENSLDPESSLLYIHQDLYDFISDTKRKIVDHEYITEIPLDGNVVGKGVEFSDVNTEFVRNRHIRFPYKVGLNTISPTFLKKKVYTLVLAIHTTNKAVQTYTITYNDPQVTLMFIQPFRIFV